MKLGRILLGAVIAAGCIFGSTGCFGVTSSVGNVQELNFVDGDKIAEITIEGYGTIKAKLFPDLAPNGVENFIMLAEQGYYDGLKIHRVLPDMMMQGGSLNGDGTGGTALINEDGSFSTETSEKARHFYGALCYANESGSNTAQFYIVNNKTPQDITTLDPEKIRAAAAENNVKKATYENGSDDYNLCAFKESYYTNLATMLESSGEDVINKYKEVGGYPMLDGGYTVFGQVFEGFEVIDAISSAELENNATGEKSRPVQDIVISSVTVIEYKTPTTAEATGEAEDENKDETKQPVTSEASATAESAAPEVIIDTTETGENAA